MKRSYGYLSCQNVDEVAQRMRSLLIGNLFSVAYSWRLGSVDNDIELTTNCRLQCDWVDRSTDPIRVSREDGLVSITYQYDHGITTLLSSYWEGSGKEPRSIHNEKQSSDAYFDFAEKGFVFKQRMPAGNLNIHAVCVQGPIPENADDICTYQAGK